MVHNFKMQPKGKSTKTLQMSGEEGVSPGVGEGTLILPYIRRLGPFKGFKLNFISIFLGLFRYMNFFFVGWGVGYVETVNIWGEPSQTWNILGSYF